MFYHQKTNQRACEYAKLCESFELTNNITLNRLGGHFKGGTVLHWKGGNHIKVILLTGDIIQVIADCQ